MRKAIPLIIAVSIFSCNSSRHKVNPEALKLNDSAMRLFTVKPHNKANTQAAINLLNKATAIDSTLYMAYWNKAGFEVSLKQYDNALVTFNKIISFQPYNGFAQTSVGNILTLKGDTLSAQQHYITSVNLYNQILDTMHMSTPGRDEIEMEKAINLILLNKQQEGNAILMKLYNNTTDTLHKRMYKNYIGVSKKVLIETMTGVDDNSVAN